MFMWWCGGGGNFLAPVQVVAESLHDVLHLYLPDAKLKKLQRASIGT
jgi:hypothetical protein